MQFNIISKFPQYKQRLSSSLFLDIYSATATQLLFFAISLWPFRVNNKTKTDFSALSRILLQHNCKPTTNRGNSPMKNGPIRQLSKWRHKAELLKLLHNTVNHPHSQLYNNHSTLHTSTSSSFTHCPNWSSSVASTTKQIQGLRRRRQRQTTREMTTNNNIRILCCYQTSSGGV